jgi:hypothetical protein
VKIRLEALVASLFAAAATVVAAAGVAAVTMLDAEPAAEPGERVPASWARDAVAGGSLAPVPPALREGILGSMPSQSPAPRPERTADPIRSRGATRPAGEVVVGIASTYPGTAGWMGQATVALPGALGGAFTGEVNGHVTVCADRCARLPVVDWCQCYWGTADQRVVDLSHPAWALVSDAPLAQGLLEVRLILER